MLKFKGARSFTSAEKLINRVRDEIFENGATYKTLAEKAGVATATVQRLANGKTRWPRPTTLFPLLQSLGLVIDIRRGD
jgi:transcriptional regulator with XRE-family HTH domain